jgi:hypothetical protein
MAQVVAEEFGLTVEDIHICTGDSKSVGYSGEPGRAGAVAPARGRELQCAAEQLDYAGGTFRARTGGAVVSLAEPMQATLTDGAIVGCGVSTKLPLGVEIGAHGGGALAQAATRSVLGQNSSDPAMMRWSARLISVMVLLDADDAIVAGAFQRCRRSGECERRVG